MTYFVAYSMPELIEKITRHYSAHGCEIEVLSVPELWHGNALPLVIRAAGEEAQIHIHEAGFARERALAHQINADGSPWEPWVELSCTIEPKDWRRLADPRVPAFYRSR